MSWDDDALRGRFSTDAYNSIMTILASHDVESQLTGLQSLGDTVAYGDESLLSSFPTHNFSEQIVKFLASPIEFVQESAARCVFLLLEAHPHSTRELLSLGALAHIQLILRESKSQLS
jgi:hypothetical protein